MLQSLQVIERCEKSQVINSSLQVKKINHKNKVVKIKLCLLSLLPPSFPPPNCNTSMLRGILAQPVASPVGNGQRMTQLAWNKSRSDLHNDPYFPNAMVPTRSRFWIGGEGYFSEFVWSLLHAQSSTSFRLSASYLEILIKHKCSPVSCTTQWPGMQNKSFPLISQIHKTQNTSHFSTLAIST